MTARPTLAGDIRGTKTALAWANDGAIVGPRTCRSTHYLSFTDIVREFLASSPDTTPLAACFGVAGPVGVIVSPTIALLGAAHAARQVLR